MSEHNALSEFVAGLEPFDPDRFRPFAWYNGDGDTLEIALEPGPYVIQRFDALISVRFSRTDPTRITARTW